MAITGIHHINLTIPPGSEEVARAFYSYLLGLIEVPKPVGSDRSRGCWFEAGDFQIHISPDPDFRPAKVAHPGFLVSDLSNLRRRLETAKVPTADGTNIAGLIRCFVFDPFGNRIELLQKVAPA